MNAVPSPIFNRWESVARFVDAKAIPFHEYAQANSAQFELAGRTLTVRFSTPIENVAIMLPTNPGELVAGWSPQMGDSALQIVTDQIKDTTLRIYSSVKVVVLANQIINSAFCGSNADTYREAGGVGSDNPTLELNAHIEGMVLVNRFNRVHFQASRWIKGLKADHFGAAEFSASNCRFEGCRFTGWLVHVNALNTQFIDCRWSPQIETASLKGATFRGSIVTLDTWVELLPSKDVDFQAAAELKDEWIDLREDFTGLRLYKILTLTLAFFSPLVLKAGILALYGRMLPAGTVIYDVVPVWQLILFGDYTGLRGLVHYSFVSVLLVFNVLRLIVTFHVVRLADREDYLRMGGFNRARPKLLSREGRIVGNRYDIPHPLLRKAWWVRRLYWVAIAYAAYEFLTVIFAEVPRVVSWHP